jgi:hypothetical protein
MNRAMIVVVSVLSLLGPCGYAADQPATSPFDKGDREIQELRKLEWKTVDFAAQDLTTRCTALMAMEKTLTMVDGKADARIDLLLEYLKLNKLEEAFASQQGQIPGAQVISFDDACKVATALVRSQGRLAKLNAEFAGSDEATLKAYLAMYEKSARRAYGEAAESRGHVRTLGLFIEKNGKLADFQKWSAAELDRRQKEYEKAMKEKQLQAVQADLRGEAAAKRLAEQRRRQEQEEATRDMEVAMQYQQLNMAGAPVDGNADGGNGSNDAYWYGTATWPWAGMYYANPGYREQVRDRMQNVRNNPGARPVPRGGGRR